MQPLQLVVFGFALVCFRFSEARFLGTGGQTFWRVEKQKPVEMKAEPAAKTPAAAEPERGNSSEATQANRNQQAADKPFTWKFPEDPVDLERKPPKFELPQPEQRERVAARCGGSKIQVEVSQDLLGLGRMIKPEDLTLGGCSAIEIDDSAHVLVFESELHTCGSKRVVTDGALIYGFTLIYKPRVSSSTGIIRSQSFVIGVECHYPR